MGRTSLGECARCHILAHRPLDEPYACPTCGGPLAPGLVDVGFGDAAHVFGEPGAPWAPPPEAPPAPAAKSGRLVCADGHKARSQDEVKVDDWLHAHGIPHECEPKLKGMRPDWRVGNVYIEYWGLSGQQGYEARREEKLALYRKRRLKLVELFPEDVEALDAKLGFLLADRSWARGLLDVAPAVEAEPGKRSSKRARRRG